MLVLRAIRPRMVESLLSLRDDKEGEEIVKKFQKDECIFIHIPKTGGVSVKKSLFGTRGGGHRRLRSYKIIFREKEFSEYFKFAFVRNPWDRVVSAYEFLRDGGITESDKKWSKKVIPQYSKFNEFITGWLDRKNVYDQIHFMPQYEFLRLGKVKPMVDYVGKFECLQEDFEKICDKIGKKSNLEHKNKSERKKNYRKYYNSKTKEIVKEVYREDVNLFEYKF